MTVAQKKNGKEINRNGKVHITHGNGRYAVMLSRRATAYLTVVNPRYLFCVQNLLQWHLANLWPHDNRRDAAVSRRLRYTHSPFKTM